YFFFFFFQAEDGIRDLYVTGVQTCALPILRRRRHIQALDLGKEQQMVLEMRPAHNPTQAYGFVGVVVSLKDLSASVWLWHRNDRSEERRVGKECRSGWSAYK